MSLTRALRRKLEVDSQEHDLDSQEHDLDSQELIPEEPSQGSKKTKYKIELPWESGETPKNANLIIPLKFPINISKLIPRDTIVTDAFGRCATKTYDITCFSTVKFVMTQLGFALRETNPDYHWRVYAYRSIRKTKEDVVGNLKLHFNLDHNKKFIHVNVDLLE